MHHANRSEAKPRAEDFLKTYPQTIVKKPVLDMLVDTYRA